MSGAAGDLARVRQAFDRPTLSLLNQKWSPIVVTVFKGLFSGQRTRIPADQFHVQVESVLDELSRAGEDVPDGTGRELARFWVRSQWMSLTSNDALVEEYALTSHAQEALDYVERLSGDRAVFGESRIRTILDAARRAAAAANPDREAQIDRLDEQITELTARRDYLAAGGEIETATDDRMLDEYLNLTGLLSSLPADFIAVSERMYDMRRRIIQEFRTQGRTSGEVLDEYLERTDELMTASWEGRAFTGAVDLLRDERLLETLRHDIAAILAHPFTDAMSSSERTELRRTAMMIRRGMETVLTERHRLSGTLQTHMRRHNALRDKELDDALRDCQDALGPWMAESKPRTKGPWRPDVAGAKAKGLRTRWWDPAEHEPPDPLADPDDDETTETDLVSIRAQGGPTLTVLRDRVLSLTGSDVTASEAFNALPPDLRRPVEILGLLHVSAAAGFNPAPGREEYRTIRPDGQAVMFTGPRVVFTGPDPDEGSTTP
jgi:hypothetical protein